MERVLWANRHVTAKATAAFSHGAAAADATVKTRSLSSDIKARKSGQYVGDDVAPELKADDVNQAIASALDLETEISRPTEAESGAAQRWKDLSAWQARVTALAALPTDGPLEIAQIVKAATAKASEDPTPTAQLQGRHQRGRTTEPRSTSV